MSSVITTDGRTRMNELAGNEEALVIDRMVLAYIADLDTSLAADPDQQMPDDDDIVYTYEIPDDYKGYVDSDQVVYSMILGSDVGSFKFNWIGLIEADTDTVITVTQTAESSKYPTDLTTNTTGNMITRNVILSYQDAQNLTGITVTAETWQFDYQADISAHIAEIVDPTQEGTSAKHLTDSQAKIWQDHTTNDDIHFNLNQIGSRTTDGTWTLTGLSVNKPLFVVFDSDCSGTVQIRYRIITGGYGGDQVENYYHKLSSDVAGENPQASNFVIIPYLTIITIELVQDAGANWVLRAYQ